jgi:DNA-binding beta-propeller fold protein YncE
VPVAEQGFEVIMALKTIDKIAIAASVGSSFDHGAFDPKTRRVFVAHTGHDCVEVIDHDNRRHIATLSGFQEVAGIVADDGIVLTTNRGAATLAWIDASTLETRAVHNTGPRPNGVAVVSRQRLAIVAAIGDETHGPKLHGLSLDGERSHVLELPGRPRWCVTDAAAARVFVAIREPSMVLVARLPDLKDVQHWHLPVSGAHGVDIDHKRGRIYVACDAAALVEVEIGSGNVTHQWSIAGEPDVTFFNPATGLVHVAIGQPGLVQSIDPLTNVTTQFMTGQGAHTTALAAPDQLYVFSPSHGGALVLADA